MERKKEEEERRKKEIEKNAICSGHLRLCQQPRAAHALRSDQKLSDGTVSMSVIYEKIFVYFFVIKRIGVLM